MGNNIVDITAAEAERFSNGVSRMFSVSKDDLLRSEAQWKRT